MSQQNINPCLEWDYNPTLKDPISVVLIITEFTRIY